MTKQETASATPKERKTVTIDFTDFANAWEQITDSAAADERPVSTWLRRFIVQHLTKPAA